MQTFRLGELIIFGTPFELFYGIKQRILQETGHNRLLVLSLCNDSMGYAPTKEMWSAYDKDFAFYPRDIVPFYFGKAPFTEHLEDEIVGAFYELL